MKKIQIDEKLFVQMVKYFYSDELGFDDCELNELSIRGKVPSVCKSELSNVNSINLICFCTPDTLRTEFFHS